MDAILFALTLYNEAKKAALEARGCEIGRRTCEPALAKPKQP